MRVVIVTGRAPHHKHLCAELMKVCQVAGIIHPAEPRPRATRRLQGLIRQVKSKGWPVVALHVLGKITARAKVNKHGGLVQTGDFSEGVAVYNRIPLSLIHSGCDVRQPATADLLRSLQPNLCLFLGGPVYPKAFIEASPLSLNFHSGISPLYNGTASIKFAFANGHPHLTGGTLMVMATEIDGGGILGHYLPQVQSGDSPDSLFDKTVRGAAVMYARLLAHLQAGKSLWPQIQQAPPLFYTRDFDFNWHHDQMIARNLRNDLPARYARGETLVEYWREPTEVAAHNLYRATLDRLLWGTARPNEK
jgi:methionyl-tRNA formyltransferase